MTVGKEDSDFEFGPGDRVRLSALGLECSPKLRPPHAGVVLNVLSRRVSVLLDGRKNSIWLHTTYIEPEPSPKPKRGKRI